MIQITPSLLRTSKRWKESNLNRATISITWCRHIWNSWTTRIQKIFWVIHLSHPFCRASWQILRKPLNNIWEILESKRSLKYSKEACRMIRLKKQLHNLWKSKVEIIQHNLQAMNLKWKMKLLLLPLLLHPKKRSLNLKKWTLKILLSKQRRKETTFLRRRTSMKLSTGTNKQSNLTLMNLFTITTMQQHISNLANLIMPGTRSTKLKSYLKKVLLKILSRRLRF